MLRFADLGVALSKLEPDGLGQVGVETDALLQKIQPEALTAAQFPETDIENFLLRRREKAAFQTATNSGSLTLASGRFLLT